MLNKIVDHNLVSRNGTIFSPNGDGKFTSPNSKAIITVLSVSVLADGKRNVKYMVEGVNRYGAKLMEFTCD